MWFGQKDPIKVQISRLSTARMKINQIPLVICQAASNFSFKICIMLQCYDTYFLWNFLAETLYTFDKKSPSIYNFSDFECSNESLPNSSCHFWNHKVRVYSNFASLLSVMKDELLFIFLAQKSYTLDKK